jgi:carboxyl-terminal processing protease
MRNKNSHLVLGTFFIINLLPLFVLARPKEISPSDLYELTRFIVKQNYIDPNFNGQNIADWSVEKKYKDKLKTYDDATKAIRTMLTSLTNQQTRFITKQEYATEAEIVNGSSELAGAGLTIEKVSNKTVIQLLSKNAIESGLMPQDELLEINGKPTENLSLSEIQFSLKGKPESTVKLMVKRNSSESKEFTVKLNKDRLPTAPEWQMGRLDPEVCYIHVSTFIYYKTADDLATNLISLGNCPSLVLDLRGNTGGLISSIRETAGIFLP